MPTALAAPGRCPYAWRHHTPPPPACLHHISVLNLSAENSMIITTAPPTTRLPPHGFTTTPRTTTPPFTLPHHRSCTHPAHTRALPAPTAALALPPRLPPAPATPRARLPHLLHLPATHTLLLLLPAACPRTRTTTAPHHYLPATWDHAPRTHLPPCYQFYTCDSGAAT